MPEISGFIRSKVVGRKYGNAAYRSYVQELLRIEYFIRDGVHSMTESYSFHHLKRKYREEYEAIYEEINPEGFKRSLKQEKSFMEEAEKIVEEQAKFQSLEESREKVLWLALGGEL